MNVRIKVYTTRREPSCTPHRPPTAHWSTPCSFSEGHRGCRSAETSRGQGGRGSLSRGDSKPQREPPHTRTHTLPRPNCNLPMSPTRDRVRPLPAPPTPTRDPPLETPGRPDRVGLGGHFRTGREVGTGSEGIDDEGRVSDSRLLVLVPQSSRRTDGSPRDPFRTGRRRCPSPRRGLSSI